MKISRIFCLTVIFIAFASCSQDIEIEESIEQVSEVVPFNFNFKLADEIAASTRRRVHFGGHSTAWGDKAYYKWNIGDKIGVICPDAPEGYQTGVYEITKLHDFGDNNSDQTEELTTVNGGVGYEKGKEDEPYRIYYGYPAGAVQITGYGASDLSDIEGSFIASINSAQVGTIETKDLTNGAKCYNVGDWNQAICAGARQTTPAASKDYDWFTVYALFTAAELEFTVPENGYSIKEITLEANKIDGSDNSIDICGSANGTFVCQNGTIKFTEFTPAGSNKLTLSIGNTGQQLNSNDKLCATMFFFPCGPSGDNGHTGDTVEHTMDLKIGVKYSNGTTEKTQYLNLKEQKVLLRGYNHVVLPTLPAIN